MPETRNEEGHSKSLERKSVCVGTGLRKGSGGASGGRAVWARRMGSVAPASHRAHVNSMEADRFRINLKGSAL